MLKTDDPDFQEGVRLFNEGKYFEAHEAWEALWRRTGKPDPGREAIHGLIQLAAACHHLGRGNLKGARSCLENARKHLGSSFPELVRAIEQAVERGSTDNLPKIVIMVPQRYNELP